jgi:hypothetical protein
MSTFVYSYGARIKTPRRTKSMSINSVGSNPILPQAVQKASEGSESTLEKPENPVDNKVGSDSSKGTDGSPYMAEDYERGAKFDCCSNTADFLSLRNGLGREEEQYAVLDEVISSMKQEIEEVGEALESMAEKIKEVSSESVGLSILKKTFEAIDKYRNNE